MTIPLSQPCIGDREEFYVARVLRSGRLSLGPMLEQFESRFAEYIGTRYAVAVNSGTSALHLCIKALGIGPQDEVLTTSFSFVASTNCFLYEGATPAFADIDPVDLNLDANQVRQILARGYTWDRGPRRLINRFSGRTLKAILPVHVFGLSCDMAAILDVAREFNLAVIEDACEAFGAEYDGKHAGTFGNASAFAFYPNKQITTAEGGMIVTDDERIADLCRSLRNQGRDGDAGWLSHPRLGYNYRLSELHCALGVAQMERADDILDARERVAGLYRQFLCRIPQIALPAQSAKGRRSWFAYVIRVTSAMPGDCSAELRNRLMLGLRERGIACQAYFPAIHLQPYISDAGIRPHRPLPLTERASETCLALPFFTAMSAVEVAEVCSAVRELVRNLDGNMRQQQVSGASDRRVISVAQGNSR
jgi:perosamine synthetase